MDANLRKETIIQIAQRLEEKYVLPEIGKKYSEHLLKLLNQNDYDSVTSGRRLAEKITSDLKEVRNDLHLSVMCSPTRVKNIREAEIKSEEEKLRDRELQLRAERKRNFGRLLNWIPRHPSSYLGVVSSIECELEGCSAKLILRAKAVGMG